MKDDFDLLKALDEVFGRENVFVIDEETQMPVVKKWFGTWPANCDICKTDLSTPPILWFIDGRTKQGPWALMCSQCHYSYGVGLGTGRGQKYDSKTLVKLEG